MTLIALDKIRLDGGTQPRAAIDEDVVAEYTVAMEGGAVFPPVVVFVDGAIYWLADGFHRFHATRYVGFLEIDADIRQGGLVDAILFAAGCNLAHGLRRTNADKRRAVELVLDGMSRLKQNWSDGEYAGR